MHSWQRNCNWQLTHALASRESWNWCNLGSFSGCISRLLVVAALISVFFQKVYPISALTSQVAKQASLTWTFGREPEQGSAHINQTLTEKLFGLVSICFNNKQKHGHQHLTFSNFSSRPNIFTMKSRLASGTMIRITKVVCGVKPGFFAKKGLTWFDSKLELQVQHASPLNSKFKTDPIYISIYISFCCVLFFCCVRFDF